MAEHFKVKHAHGTYTVRELPIVSPPIPPGGGRLLNDSAGELAQITNGGHIRFLAYIEFLPGGRSRGNHLHSSKTETMYIMSGRLEATFKNTVSGEVTKRVLKAGDLVTIRPGCAHAYVATERTQALELGDREYDPDDTVPYNLISS